jgi:hypothetical protein
MSVTLACSVFRDAIIAICIVPCNTGVAIVDYKRDSNYRSKASTSPLARFGGFSPTLESNADIEMGNYTANASPIQNALHISAPANLTELTFGVMTFESGLPRGSVPPGETEQTITVADTQILCTNTGNLFSSTEIFGLKRNAITNNGAESPVALVPAAGGVTKTDYGSASSDSVDATETDPIRKYNDTLAEAAKNETADEEECVVCLSDSKAVALMPCR